MQDEVDDERALLDEIARDPENLTSYAVYGDWLLAQGDPRGEMFALWHAADERPGDHRLSDAARELLEQHADEYLGKLAPFVLEPGWDRHLALTWRGGFIASAELRAWPLESDGAWSATDVLRDLLELPAARFLTRLRSDAQGSGDVIAMRPLPALRELWLGSPTMDWFYDGADLGALHAIWPSLPNLRELTIHGVAETLGGIELPRLRRATFRMPPTRGAGLRPVVTARWPELEALQLWYPDERDAVTALLLGRDDLVTLGDLGFIAARFADEICKVLVASPLAAQLNRLSFAHAQLTDAGIETLLAHRSALPNLAVLDISATRVSDSIVAKASQQLGNILVHRRGRTTVFEDDI